MSPRSGGLRDAGARTSIPHWFLTPGPGPCPLSKGQSRPELTEAQTRAAWVREGQRGQDTDSRRLHDHELLPASPGNVARAHLGSCLFFRASPEVQ